MFYSTLRNIAFTFENVENSVESVKKSEIFNRKSRGFKRFSKFSTEFLLKTLFFHLPVFSDFGFF